MLFRGQDILLVVYLIWINCSDRVDGGQVIYVQIWGVKSIHILVLDQATHVKVTKVAIHARVYKTYLRLLLLSEVHALVVLS